MEGIGAARCAMISPIRLKNRYNKAEPSGRWGPAQPVTEGKPAVVRVGQVRWRPHEEPGPQAMRSEAPDGCNRLAKEAHFLTDRDDAVVSLCDGISRRRALRHDLGHHVGQHSLRVDRVEQRAGLRRP